MSAIYSYQPYQPVDQHRHHSGGYYQPTVASNGYYQGQYISQNVAAPMYHHPQPQASVMQHQIYAQPPAMAAPAVNPYMQGNAYGYNNANAYYQVPQQQQYAQPQQQQQQQEQQGEQAVTGGVSSVLDYDLSAMSKFATYLAFRLFARSDTENTKFVSSLKSVLSATRLPLSSLILANYYILQKYELDPASFNNSADELIYQNVVISLVLANKANDDNTFINKSWAAATGLSVKLINVLEANWLNLLDWKLHDVQMEKYDELMLQFNRYSKGNTTPQRSSRYVRDPISPILPSSSQSPRDNSPSRFNNYSSTNWYSEYTATTPTPYSYEGFAPSSYGHQKSYSFNEPEYCSRTGSYQKMMYCTCRYCSTPPRSVDWSYNVAAAC